MSRALLVLNSDAVRAKAAAWVRRAPLGTRLTFQGPRRTLPQNDLMWALLTSVAVQVPWHGARLTPEDWKLIFLDALNGERRVVPNLDGDGLVALGRSSSDLSKEEMSELIELILAWGAMNEVDFSEPKAPEPFSQEEAHP